MDCSEEALLGPDEESITIHLTTAELAMLEAEARAMGICPQALARRLIESTHRRLADDALALPGSSAGH